MDKYFIWYKTIHVISVVSWMAAIFYLPRLFVYHSKVKRGSQIDKTFQIMEKRLIKFIMVPALLATYIFGLLTAYIYGFSALGTWFHIKLIAVLGLTIIQILCIKWTKDFFHGKNRHNEKFYKIINEIPLLLMIVAVTMVIVKPFE